MKHRSASYAAALFAALTPVLFGQTPAPATNTEIDRVLRYAHTEVPQSLHEIATAIRAVTEIRQVSVAADQRVLALLGSKSQMEMAEWLFARLDQAPTLRSAEEVAEYAVSGGADDVVRVFYLNYPESIQAFQEVATAVRSVIEIRRTFTYNALKAIVVRGTADQIAMAEWLVRQLDRPPSRVAIGPFEYTLPKHTEDVIKVYFLSNTAEVRDFQEISTMVRSISELGRVFTYNALKAFIARGNPDQLGLATWLIREMDQPPSRAVLTPREYRMPTADDLVRVVFFPHIATVQGFQEVAASIRQQVGIRRLFTYNAPRALVLRGTAAQLAHAESLSKEFERR